MKNKNTILILLSAIMLSIITANSLGDIFKQIVGEAVLNQGGWLQIPRLEIFSGFFISYAFFATLGVMIFCHEKKYLTLGALLSLEILSLLGVVITLIFVLDAIIIGWLLGQAMNIFSHRKKALGFLAALILVVIFTPIAGNIYEKIIGEGMIKNPFLDTSHPEYFEGFLLSYAFFITLMVTIVYRERKYRTLLMFLSLEFLILFGVFEAIIFSADLIVIAWLMGQGLVLVYERMRSY